MKQMTNAECALLLRKRGYKRNKMSPQCSGNSGKPGASLLDDYRAEISRCVKCGSCRAVCPSFLSRRDEAFSPRGRMALIKAVLDGRLGLSRVFEDRLETCTACLACEATCASKVPVCDIIQAGKERAVKELGKGFIKTAIGSVLANDRVMRKAAWLAPLALHYHPQFGRKSSRAAGAKFRAGKMTSSGVQSSSAKKRNQGAKGTVLFFPGCAINYLQPEIGTAAIRLLNTTGFEAVMPDGLKCCGRPLLSLGDRNQAEESAAHNISLFAEARPDAVVTACPSCALTFKREYPKLVPPGAKIPALFDIHEFLAHQLDGVTFLPLKTTITWHDPCHLNRGLGLAMTARELLHRVPGAGMIEMNNSDACCGFGGTMRVTHPELSDAIAAKKVKNILATKAGAVVTGCPGCRMQIGDGLRRAGSDIEVVHTVQLLEQLLSNED